MNYENKIYLRQKHNNNYEQQWGKKKPVIILFNGYGSSSVFWSLKHIGNYKLQEIDFVKKLEKIGDVYTFDSNFFNIKYYFTNGNDKDNSERKMNDKYNLYTDNIDFNLEDLEYKNICEKVYDGVKKNTGKIENTSL